MKKWSVIGRASVLAFVSFLAFASFVPAQGPITPGDLVVVRVGDGSGALSNASTAVFLDEFTTSGTAVQSIALPTAASGSNLRFTNSGSATSEGNLNVSVNGQYLTLAGYDAAPGLVGVASSTTASVLRVIARVDMNGTVDTSTSLATYSGNNVRSACSVTGNEFWVGGPGNGVSYVAGLGATSGTQLATNLANIRTVQVSSGQLYCSSASGAFQGVSSVGVGAPTTSGETITILPGMPTASGPSAYDFWFADTVTCYVADDRAPASGGGIQKWVFSAGAWSLAYTMAPAGLVGCRGLTGAYVGGNFVLYATTAASPGSQLVTVTDTGAGSAFTTLATAATNTIFRGVRLARGATAVTSVGAGCAGGAAQAPVLSTTQQPYLGNVGFALDVTQAQPGSPAFLFIAIGTDPVGIPVGAGCSIHLDYTTLLYLLSINLSPIGPVGTDAFGAASIPLGLPSFWAYAGVHLGAQVAILDGASPIGVDLTNALDLLLN